jgi:hypothetical protein
LLAEALKKNEELIAQLHPASATDVVHQLVDQNQCRIFAEQFSKNIPGRRDSFGIMLRN